jgi:hypothetical protein
MKALKVIAQVIGYLIIALAAVMLVSGAPWACVFLLIVGGLELWITSRLLRPKPDPEPAVEITEEEKAARDKRIAEAKEKGVACCPYCGSTSIFITYGKVDGRVRHCTCISCGKVFQPGQKP